MTTACSTCEHHPTTQSAGEERARAREKPVPTSVTAALGWHLSLPEHLIPAAPLPSLVPGPRPTPTSAHWRAFRSPFLQPLGTFSKASGFPPHRRSLVSSGHFLSPPSFSRPQSGQSKGRAPPSPSEGHLSLPEALAAFSASASSYRPDRPGWSQEAHFPA